MATPAKKAKTAAKEVKILEDTLREAPFVPDEGPGATLLSLPGGPRSRGVSPGAFAAIKAALEQCADEVGADFGPEERKWINRVRDGALRRLEPDAVNARREAKRRALAELAQEAAEERAALAETRLQVARARDEVAALRAIASAQILDGASADLAPAVPPVTPEEKHTFDRDCDAIERSYDECATGVPRIRDLIASSEEELGRRRRGGAPLPPPPALKPAAERLADHLGREETVADFVDDGGED